MAGSNQVVCGRVSTAPGSFCSPEPASSSGDVLFQLAQHSRVAVINTSTSVISARGEFGGISMAIWIEFNMHSTRVSTQRL